ncbi:MAG: GntR family transcriptional regulator, partial [bacterium]|nr:GntR family transcriptional regulator [bacterium]
MSEKLVEGDKLVSIRDIATRFNINPITIMKSYNQLEGEGFLYSRRGSGYYVKADDNRRRLEGKTEMFRKTIAAFLEKIAGMGFTVNDLLKELKKYTMETKDGGKKHD